MKTLNACLATLVACLPALASAEPAPVQAVAAVDLARYAGNWHEIAAFPMHFQRQCLGDTTAEYARRDDGDLSVVNRCRTEDGFAEATARAQGHDLSQLRYTPQRENGGIPGRTP